MDKKENTCLLRTVFRISLLMAGMAGSVMMLFLLTLSVTGAGEQTAVPAFAPAELTLPVTVEGTHIQVLYLMAYEGPFLEDGSMDEVVDAAALVVRNTSAYDIEKAGITVKTADGTLVFSAEYIPAGERLMILEQDRQLYTRQQPTQLSGWERLCAEQGTAAIQITHEDMGTIRVTNTTDKALFNIRFLHKNYLPESDIYIGGITYETKLDSLQPGESVHIQPEHYAAGYSKIFRIDAQ